MSPYDATTWKSPSVNVFAVTFPWTVKTFDPVSFTCKFEPTLKWFVGAEFAIPTFAVVTKPILEFVN